MSKIIKFSDIKSSQMQNRNYESIQSSEIQECMDNLCIQAGILHMITSYAEDMLQDFHLHPALFSIDPESKNDYMKLNFMDFLSGAEDICVGFKAHFGGAEYIFEVTVICCEQKTVEFDGALFRKSSEGSEIYDMNAEEWCRCPD